MADVVLLGVQARRAGLRRAMGELEKATAAPLAGRAEAWREHLVPALDALVVAWDKHVAETESEHGLFAEVRTEAPRLVPYLERLGAEHAAVRVALDGLRGEAMSQDADEQRLGAVREGVVDLLAQLVRHRQVGADLLYQAYQVDLGGG